MCWKLCDEAGFILAMRTYLGIDNETDKLLNMKC